MCEWGSTSEAHQRGEDQFVLPDYRFVYYWERISSLNAQLVQVPKMDPSPGLDPFREIRKCHTTQR